MMMSALKMTADTVVKTLYWSEDTRQGLPIALENAMHVDAERLRDSENDCKEQQDLNPTVDGHVLSSELFRTEQGVDEVRGEAER